METKVCTGCSQEKGIDCYYVKRKRKDGSPELYGRCKDCQSRLAKEKYAADLEASRQKSREAARRRSKEDKAAYRKKWYEENPEAAKDIERRADAKRKDKKKAYREANKERIKAQNAEYKAKNKEKINTAAAEYREANKEALAERQRQWREAHPERDYEIHARWKRENADLVNAATHRRRCQISESKENYTVEEWEALKRKQDYRCAMCGRREPEIKLTIDHIVPVSAKGSNAISNIQALCLPCNLKKGDSLPEEINVA